MLDHHVANCCTDLAIKKVEAELTRFIVARSFSNYHRLQGSGEIKTAKDGLV